MDINMEPAALPSTLQTFSGTVGDRPVELTTVTIDSATWFKGADIAASLGYVDLKQAIRKHVEDEDKVKLENLRGIDPTAINQYERAQVFITESGLYSLVLGSRKPEARAFKRWVTSSVLPEIQKTGVYTGMATGSCEPLPSANCQAPDEVEIQTGRLARLQAIKAAKEVADQFGFLLSDDLQEHALMAVNEVLLPAGWEQRDMIDAAEYLRRRGHGETEIRHISSEFGRALKVAQENLEGTVAVTNLQRYGPRNIPNGTCMYNAKLEAAFLNGVYEAFKQRQLYQKHVRENPLTKQIEAVLQGTRGFKPTVAQNWKRSGARRA